MPLKGNIETFHITNVLQLLHNEEKTGILRVTGQNEAVKIYIKEGNIIHATKSHQKNRLGDLLVKHGVINEKQLKECLKVAKNRSIPLGKVIVEKEYATVKSLGKIIFQQVENAIFEIFFWEKGEFEYTDKEFSTQGMVISKISIMRTLLEASRQVDEMPVLKKLVPSEDMVFKVAGTVRGCGEITLTPDEWSVLTLINGKNSVKQIISESIHDTYTVYQILNSLVSAGYIKEEATTPRHHAAEAFNRLMGVDSKMVRRELDNLGLSRSSLLRLILTRIARESFSPEELLASVEAEAKKIVNPKDIIQLNKLIKQGHVPFIESLLSLLHEKVKDKDKFLESHIKLEMDTCPDE